MLVKVNKQINVEDIADQATAIILGRIRKRFLQGVDPDGRKWEVSQAALAREASGKGGGTLYDTGDLFRSIQAVKRGKGIRGIQTDVPYALKHHKGLDGQKQRRFLDTNEDDMQFITDFIVMRLK